ncbi:pentapeptide repeat-containing protein [Pelodictyon luteolum]|uniref:Pentapeptide repeat family protein n=2 Tax=Pelodictyon luteolum TaxID=1100 RepID=Q3B3I2_CHLL3|nr:pentapeptide repeat-containing protein [Pelodictyon luteolum]ABB24099.1 pentapeptide repeat family protein [Pelodictyon luteolum DSM 273]
MNPMYTINAMGFSFRYFLPPSRVLPFLFGALVILGSAAPLAAADQSLLLKLREGRQAWNAMRSQSGPEHPDLSGADLKGRKLMEYDLHGAVLRGADLSQTNLSGADLKGAVLDSVTAVSSILSSANLQGARLNGADLASAVLDGADCTGAVLVRADLRLSDCTGAVFHGADLKEVHFREAQLNGADLGNADIRAAYFWRANTDRMRLQGASVSETTVLDSGSYATARWAVAHGALFIADIPAPPPARTAVAPGVSAGETAAPAASSSAAVPLVGAQSVRPEKAPRKGIVNLWQRTGPLNAPYDAIQYESLKKNVTRWNRMRRTESPVAINLREADFAGKNLFGADLRGADLSAAGMRLTDLGDADLRGADLRGADLRGATLAGADLGGADLCGANLWRANMSRTRLSGARVSGATVLDSGKKATPGWAEKHDARYIAD